MAVFGEKIPYKIAWQYASIVVALVLVGQFVELNVVINTMTTRAFDNIAGVIGMAVAVPPNQENTLAQALENKAVELSERERAIDAREREIRAILLLETQKQNRFTLLLVMGVTLLLVVLIGINFYLDQRRSNTPTGSTGAQKTGTHAHEGEFQTRL